MMQCKLWHPWFYSIEGQFSIPMQTFLPLLIIVTLGALGGLGIYFL